MEVAGGRGPGWVLCIVLFAQGLVVAFVIQKVGVGVGPLELVAAVHQQLTGLHSGQATSRCRLLESVVLASKKARHKRAVSNARGTRLDYYELCLVTDIPSEDTRGHLSQMKKSLVSGGKVID